MTEERLYRRQTALLACFAAWTFGIATGVVIGFAYHRRSPDPEAEADRRYAEIAFRRPPVTKPPAPSPSPSEWAMPMTRGIRRDCPQVTLEEMRVHEGADFRRVVLTVKLTNGHQDRTCLLGKDEVAFRDGDGNIFRHDGTDLAVAALGVKRERLAFTVPNRLELAQLVVADELGRMNASDFEFVRRTYR